MHARLINTKKDKALQNRVHSMFSHFMFLCYYFITLIEALSKKKY